MRGRAIESITRADLDQLIADGVAEDRRLEFKVDIPVSEEEQKRQRKIDPDRVPLDRSWVKGARLPDYGRDALAEEIVAFANADGGTLILGLDETKEAPPRAEKLNPLPDVAGLERRLRDVLLSCVEPRLPYVAVRGIPTEPDGSGVVIIEVSASMLGPHWVIKTRKPTIRREDKCVPLSMPEVHDMVLRNARGIDTALARLDQLRKEFDEQFVDHLDDAVPYVHLRTGRGNVREWLRSTGQSALGAQVIVMPHYDLSLPRFETLDGLLPADDAIAISTPEAVHRQQWLYVYNMLQSDERRILNGVGARQTGGFDKDLKVYRSGRVVASFIQHREVEKCTCRADLIVTLVGFALGVFDRLRKKSSYPNAPAEVAVDLSTCQEVGVGNYSGVGFNSAYGRLDECVSFDRYTIGEAADIPFILQEIAADLFNAAGLRTHNLPEIIWSDPQ
ncbi:AlbA family DNA-binding domain-containing protein [Methylobacterium fujisawaense]|uniref:AlbA family DNA-binding domain-containing protein n=1 Tax=Methylobacterium fujisawaense TaxID=107400 RepID=UPI00244BFE76|nr:ATP-binding protein [Methylobacterium fujisawaense]MDH3028644.1 ATP-binding protein [Methylobacterium fujisawaense]